MITDPRNNYSLYTKRYADGEWRGPIFRDMILDDISAYKVLKGRVVCLDIGCGGGFDSDLSLQASLSAVTDEYIGIEPDPVIELAPVFTDTHRCSFENAVIPPSSIDFAFSIMVLEHIPHPNVFWNKIYDILRPGGVFWGITVDARHWFVKASLLADKLKVKDIYLNLLHGKRGTERYENYGVYYMSNTPSQIGQFTNKFDDCNYINFNQVGALDYYVPTKLRQLFRRLDQMSINRGWPGSILAVRVQK